MKGFYIPNHELIEVKSPQFVHSHYRHHWYKECGFKVNFSHLTFERAAKFLSIGFAPSVPLNHGLECGEDQGWKTNYLYPISFGDNSDIPF